MKKYRLYGCDVVQGTEAGNGFLTVQVRFIEYGSSVSDVDVKSNGK